MENEDQRRKEQSCHVHQKACPTSERRIDYKGTDIPWVSEMKYLEVVLDKKMTWKAQTDHAGNKGKAIAQILRPLLGRKGNLNLRNNTIVVHTMLYKVASWGQSSKRNRNRIQVVQNNTLRTLVQKLTK